MSYSLLTTPDCTVLNCNIVFLKTIVDLTHTNGQLGVKYVHKKTNYITKTFYKWKEEVKNTIFGCVLKN